MITLHKGTTGNEWTVTLTEASTLVDPDYVWQLTSLATGATVVFYAEDTSLATIRYNQFSIDDVGATAVDYQDGKIHLVPAGYWKYEVFETVGASPHNLNIGDAAGIVEYGMLNVIGATTEDFDSFTIGDSDTIPVFEG